MFLLNFLDRMIASTFSSKTPKLSSFWVPQRCGTDFFGVSGVAGGTSVRRIYAAGAEFSEDLKDLGQASWAFSDLLEAGRSADDVGMDMNGHQKYGHF